MKKYLRELELAGILLLVVGVVVSLLKGAAYGEWPCGVGILLLLSSYVYKALHWSEYATENKRNIVIVLMTVIFLIVNMLSRL